MTGCSRMIGLVFLLEPEEVEIRFREYAAGRASSPKLWADD